MELNTSELFSYPCMGPDDCWLTTVSMFPRGSSSMRASLDSSAVVKEYIITRSNLSLAIPPPRSEILENSTGRSQRGRGVIDYHGLKRSEKKIGMSENIMSDSLDDEFFVVVANCDVNWGE